MLALLEIFNFPRARSLARSFPPIFPLCLPEKQTGIDFLSPRVFRRALLGGAQGAGLAEVVCVYAFNYFPAAEVLFPIITRAFFDVEINTHTDTHTYRYTLSHLLVGWYNQHTHVILWVIFKLFFWLLFGKTEDSAKQLTWAI